MSKLHEWKGNKGTNILKYILINYLNFSEVYDLA